MSTRPRPRPRLVGSNFMQMHQLAPRTSIGSRHFGEMMMGRVGLASGIITQI
jgi:hypothetical protein